MTTFTLAKVGGAGRSARSIRIGEHHLGPQYVAVVRSRGWPPTRDFLSTILYGDAIGTKVSGRYRQGGRPSGVAVKRGSTVEANYLIYSNFDLCASTCMHVQSPTIACT